MKGARLALLLAAAALPAAALDVNGVRLGDPEAAIARSFPRAHCQPLQWPSTAADRRCDDAHASFAGVPARLTFYLSKDRVAGIDVGFARNDAGRIEAFLTQHYGQPAAEPGDGKRLRWDTEGAQAAMIAREQRRRASLFVAPPGFEEELYRVR